MTLVIFVMIMPLLFCLASSSTSQVLHSYNASDCPVIKTTLGNIAGIRQHTVLGNGSFCSYRGIRYAEAPVGELRFKVSFHSNSSILNRQSLTKENIQIISGA